MTVCYNENSINPVYNVELPRPKRNLGELTGILERTASKVYLDPDNVEQIIDDAKILIDAWLLGAGKLDK